MSVSQPVEGGLWYSLELVALLRNIALHNAPVRSGYTITCLLLHWQEGKAITYSASFDMAMPAFDIVWWAVLILLLLQRELSDWPYGNDTNDYNDYNGYIDHDVDGQHGNYDSSSNDRNNTCCRN